MSNKRPIYLDYMATTPVDPRVIEQMLQYLGPEGEFGNPASTTHQYGAAAARAIEQSRIKIADSIHAEPDEIVFTSGATEADNLAILGGARFYQRKGRHVITMSTEHKAVLDSVKQLEREGFSVTYLAPQADGILDLAALEQALQSDTVLVSIMHVNSETGVIQNIAEIGQLLKGRGILFHVDAAQSLGRLSIDVKALGVDLMSFSGHKMYGPKGVGALYVRHKPRIRLQPMSFGGGHEGGVRSGTLATHQIVGMATACELAEFAREEEQASLLAMRTMIWNGIKAIPTIQLNGDLDQRIAGNLNFSFAKLDGKALMTAMSELALSATSACSSSSQEPSYVIKALGKSDERARNSIRLTLGRFTNQTEVAQIIQIINANVKKMLNIDAS